MTVLASYADLLGYYDFGGERTGNSLVVREPAGVAGLITPWNYPLHQIVAKVAAALAAGCTTVLKPSEVAPLAAYELAAVLSVIGYGTEDEAVQIANGTRYGLAGAVWSADPERDAAVARRLRTGQVEINGGAFNPVAPFGGYGQSGYGLELGVHGMEEYLEIKAMQF